MARILIETDGGARTLSEKLVGRNLADDDYSKKLVERVGWAVQDAESADDLAVPAVHPRPEAPED